MASRNCIGIYYSPGQITAVSVERQGEHYRTGQSLTVQGPEETAPAPKAGEEPDESKIAEKDTEASDPGSASVSHNGAAVIPQCREQIHQTWSKIPPISLSLNGRFYQSQTHHTEFSDSRQVRQTLRYDVEEDFALDADLMALCYQEKSTGPGGADLLVHTIRRSELQDILSGFEQAGMDALVTEPDIVSWQHYLEHQEDLPRGEPVVVLGWTTGTLYILVLDSDRRVLLSRSLPCGTPAQVDLVLQTELLRTVTQLDGTASPRQLFYHGEGLDPQSLEAPARRLQLQPRALRESDAARAFAVGAGIGWLSGQTSSDFRADGLPPRTVVKAQSRALTGLSVSVGVLLLVWVLIMKLFSQGYHHRETTAMGQLKEAYQQIYPGERIPKNPAQIPSRVRRRLSEVRAKYSGLTVKTLPDSASNTMRLVFEALNPLGADFDLYIENLSVYADSATFTGSVANMEDLERLRKVIDVQGRQLEIASLSSQKTGSSAPGDVTNRRSFTLQLKVKKAEATAARKK